MGWHKCLTLFVVVIIFSECFFGRFFYCGCIYSVRWQYRNIYLYVKMMCMIIVSVSVDKCIKCGGHSIDDDKLQWPESQNCCWFFVGWLQSWLLSPATTAWGNLMYFTQLNQIIIICSWFEEKFEIDSTVMNTCDKFNIPYRIKQKYWTRSAPIPANCQEEIACQHE